MKSSIRVRIHLMVVGWKFMALGPVSTPMLEHDYCGLDAMTLSSRSERSVLRKGHTKTQENLSKLIQTKPFKSKP